MLGSFVQSAHADEFYFFYAPKILGDPNGVSMLAGSPREKIIDCIKAHGINIRKLGEDLLINGRLREQLY